MKVDFFNRLQEANWEIFRDMVEYHKQDNDIEVTDIRKIKDWRFILSGDKKISGEKLAGYRGVLKVDCDNGVVKEFITKQYCQIRQISKHIKRFAI